MRSCSFFQGTVILTVSSLLIKFLGFFYKIFLAQAMGAEGMGIYQLIFPVFAVCHSLTSSGLEVAISRFTARSRGHEQSDYLWAGLFLTLTSSLVIGLFLWTRSDFIALTLLHETRCAPLLKFLAATIPLAGFHGCFCGFCLGRKNGISFLPFRSLQNRLSESVLSGFCIIFFCRKVWKSLPCSPLQVCSPGKSHRFFSYSPLLPIRLCCLPACPPVFTGAGHCSPCPFLSPPAVSV